MVKKKKKFRPFTQCRYLPGEMSDGMNLMDLYQFNCHRYRIFTAKPVVDCAPMKMNPFTLIPVSKLQTALTQANTIDQGNKQLLQRLNYIHRNGGVLNTFNKRAYYRSSVFWRQHEREMRVYATVNKETYNVILTAKPFYSKKEQDTFWKEMEEIISKKSRFPLIVTKPKNYDLILSKEPSISSGLDQIEETARPQCFMEFRLKDGAYLGKIIIELYQEYVPVTVQNFMALCKGENGLSYKNCRFHRILRGKYIETGDITHNSGRGGMSIYGKTFHEEKHILKHSKGGVLSMKRIPPNAENNSQFIITLNEISVLDRINVVFGKVIKGSNVIYVIQDYGHFTGKPLTDVIISNCGVIESEKEEDEEEKKGSLTFVLNL